MQLNFKTSQKGFSVMEMIVTMTLVSIIFAAITVPRLNHLDSHTRMDGISKMVKNHILFARHQAVFRKKYFGMNFKDEQDGLYLSYEIVSNEDPDDSSLTNNAVESPQDREHMYYKFREDFLEYDGYIEEGDGGTGFFFDVDGSIYGATEDFTFTLSKRGYINYEFTVDKETGRVTMVKTTSEDPYDSVPGEP